MMAAERPQRSYSQSGGGHWEKQQSVIEAERCTDLNWQLQRNTITSYREVVYNSDPQTTVTENYYLFMAYHFSLLVKA